MKSRIKLVLFLIVGLGLLDSSSLYSQTEIGELMNKRKPNCYEIRRNAIELLPKYHERNQLDSVAAVLAYWEDRCETPEELFRFKILFSIEQETSFVDTVVERVGIFQYLLAYKNFASKVYSKDEYQRGYYASQGHESFKFTDYTLDWARSLLRDRLDLTTREDFFLRHYSHEFDGNFSMLRGEAFNNTALQNEYQSLVESTQINSWFRGELSLSGWFPIENLAILGNHVGFGISGGVQHKRWHAMVSIKGSFGDSRKTRNVSYKDSLYVSDKFSHVSATADIGYAVLNKRQHAIELLGSAGYNGITILEVANPVDTDNPKSIDRSALLLSGGIGYRYNFSSGAYIGLSSRYNFTNFKNLPGSDLSGGFLSIRISIGLISTDSHSQTRKLLDLE